MTEAATTLEPPAPVLEPPSPEVKRYHRQKIVAIVLSTVMAFGALAGWALILGPHIGRVVESVVGASAWLQLIGVACLLGATLQLLTLPFDFYSSFVLEHRYGLSNQTLAAWLWKKAKGYAIGGVLAIGLLSGLYALLWVAGAYWWLWATVGWLLVSLVLGQLLPIVILPLFYKVSKLDDPDLLERLRKLAEGTTLKVAGVFRLELSKETKKANAALAGLGRTRRVLLGDTLLEQFTPEEIEVVFAHELGHHVFQHLPKSIALRVLTTLIGFWLVDALLTNLAPALGYTHFADPAALPLVLLVLSAFGLLLSPLENAISRAFERQCDHYALVRTRNPQAYRSAFTKLARLNKANPDPHPLIAWLFYDHPPIRERLAMADAEAV